MVDDLVEDKLTFWARHKLKDKGIQNKGLSYSETLGRLINANDNTCLIQTRQCIGNAEYLSS